MIEELNKIKYKLETLQKHLTDTESHLINLNQQNIDLNNELAEVLEEREYIKKLLMLYMNVLLKN